MYHIVNRKNDLLSIYTKEIAKLAKLQKVQAGNQSVCWCRERAGTETGSGFGFKQEAKYTINH